MRVARATPAMICIRGESAGMGSHLHVVEYERSPPVALLQEAQRTPSAPCGRLGLARITHERFCCNRTCAAATSLVAESVRPGGRARPSVGQRTARSTLPALGAPRARLASDCAISRRTAVNNVGWDERWCRSRDLNPDTLAGARP